MTTAGAILYFFARPLTLFFLGEQTQGVADVAAPLLRIVACSLPFLAVLMVGSGALRGVGDTRWMFAITLFGLLLVRIPLAYYWGLGSDRFDWGWISGLGWGIRGAWWAMVADVVTRSLLVAARFLHGGWRETEA